MKSEYALITPTKNEEKNIEPFIESVLAQTHRPTLWIFVDASNDRTPEIIKRYSKRYKFILLKRQVNTSKKEGHINFSLALWEGYEYLKRLLKKYGTNDIKYVAKLDADVILHRDFFKRVTSYMDMNENIAIAGGEPYLILSKIDEDLANTLINSEPDVISTKIPLKKEFFLPLELPDKRVYRFSFLEQIGGFPISLYSPDSVLTALAISYGWKVVSVPKAYLYNVRPDMGTFRDKKSVYINLGRSKYYLGYPEWVVLISTIYSLVISGDINSVDMFSEYCKYKKRELEPIFIPPVKDYYSKLRVIKILKVLRRESH